MEYQLTHLEKMIESFNKKIQYLTKNPTVKSELYYCEILRDYHQRIYDAAIGKKPIVYTGLFTPSELYRAMDVIPFFPEFHALLLSTEEGLATKYMDMGEELGVSREICSAHRIGLGAVKSGQLPRPTMVVSSSAPCDVTLLTYEIYRNLFRCPAFLIDTPYGFGERQLNYMKKEMKTLMGFLEESTGQKMDYDRLREVVQISSKGYELWEKINSLRKAVPTPIKSRESTRDFAVTILAAGLPESIKYLEARYGELKGMVERGEGAVPDERHRITWLYILPYFDISITDWMADKHKAVIVVDLLSFASDKVKLDPSEPIEFLTKKAYKGGLIKSTYGVFDEHGASRDFVKMCSEYNSDAVIMLAAWGCKQYCGLSRILKDTVQEKLGLPMLILDADILDPRVVSSSQLKLKLDEFFGLLN